jgi:NAD-dependent deacetylase
MASIEDVAAWISDAAGPRVSILTGAGISTDSGIPDFRGPNGIWTRDPAVQRLSSLGAYLADQELRKEAWRRRAEHPAWTAQPNAAHHALVALERRDRLHTVITQNIDGLHQKAGSSPQLVVEIHGSIHTVTCLTCAQRTPMRVALDRVEAGEPDPPCLACGGILKSSTIAFGQALDPGVFQRAVRAARECGLFMAVGTTLQVQPAAGLARVAVEHGARLVIVNRDPTPYDGLASAVIGEPIGDILPRLVAAGVPHPGEPTGTAAAS